MSTYTDASLIVTPNAVKESKLYSLKGADLDVVRATSATRVNNEGLIETVGLNIPRLDYSNGSCPSILVEPQRTNLLLRSEEFDVDPWSRTFTTVTANDALSPDGTTNADKLIVNNSASIGAYIQQLITKSSIAITYTVSCFAKANELNAIRLYVRDSISALNNAQVYYNISDGSLLIASTSGGTFSNASSTITSAGNGFYRVNLTFTSSTDTQLQVRIIPYDTIKTTGNATDGIYIWGTQLEAGSYATSYIPTVASTVTRNADVISKTGISSLIGQTEGTIYWEGIAKNQTDIIGINRSIANGIYITKGSGNLFRINIYNSSNAITLSDTIIRNSNTKIAISYKSGNNSLFVNGVKVATSTSLLTFNASLSSIGLNDNYLIGTNAHFTKSVLVYKTALSDSECIDLTTL